ncbi:MAG: protein translocase subunit SecF [bacterium]
MVDFLKYKYLYLAISLIVIFSGFFFLFRYGISFSIDFTGGSNISYLFNKTPDKKLIESALSDSKIDYNKIDINKNIVNLKTEPITEKVQTKLAKTLETKTKSKIDMQLFETVGPSVGKDTMNKTLTAAVLGVLVILSYIGFAFKGFNFALSAIIALFHDLLVLIGVYTIIAHFFGAEIDTLFITAVLTTMSFSVHDTIVIFDKIREHIKEEGKVNIGYITNKALTETMVRSLNNSMTIVFMLLALILFGGTTIKFFIIALLIGTITGTYSSPFVASPLLVWLEKRKKK